MSTSSSLTFTLFLSLVGVPLSLSLSHPVRAFHSSPFWKRSQLPLVGLFTPPQNTSFPMEQAVIEELQNLYLTKEEEKERPITA